LNTYFPCPDLLDLMNLDFDLFFKNFNLIKVLIEYDSFSKYLCISEITIGCRETMHLCLKGTKNAGNLGK
jgi:hypothetical protein